MSEGRSFPWSAPHDDTHCWALWREDLPCPNAPTWRVQNTTNAGYSLMCDVHKEGFATDYPHALVIYTTLLQPQGDPLDPQVAREFGIWDVGDEAHNEPPQGDTP